MERECQEECVLIHFQLLRETIDRYLKKHSFCDECTKMVNKAYEMLVADEDVPAVVTGACNAPEAPRLVVHTATTYRVIRVKLENCRWLVV